MVGSLLAEEIRKKSVDHGKQDTALTIERGRYQFWGKSSEKDRSRSKSANHKDFKCHHCGKKGHIKRDCFTWKKENKDGKKKEDDQKDAGKKSSVKIEEINAITTAVTANACKEEILLKEKILFMSCLPARRSTHHIRIWI